jgi:hypothetical protein
MAKSMQSTVAWPFPGKVLVLDDSYDDVKEAISQLLEAGIPVMYWKGDEDPPKAATNIRAVIADLSFGDSLPRGEPSFYLPAIERLQKISGPYFVIIMSLDYIPDDPKHLKEALKTLDQTIPGFVFDDGILKADLLTQPQKVATFLKSALSNRLVMGLILQWEKIVDSSKDKMLRDFVKEELEHAMVQLVKLIYVDMDSNAVPREFIDRLSTLHSRTMADSESISSLRPLLEKIRKVDLGKVDHDKIDQRLHWSLMYYNPMQEDIWTGDIFKDDRKNDYAYDIVLTPACDISHQKAGRILVCSGCALRKKFFKDVNYPLYTKDRMLYQTMKRLLEKKDKKAIHTLSGMLERAYIQEKGYLEDRPWDRTPDKFYRIWNFRENPTGEQFGICFDFQDVTSYTIEEYKKLKTKPVCRLDSPFINLMLQKYGVYASRMGTPEINRSPPTIYRIATSK